MNEFKVTDYISFDEASRTINFTKGCILQNFNNIKQEIVKLNSDDIFCGPACESVLSGWNGVVVNPYEESIQELGKAEIALPSFKQNYVIADNSNASNIGGVSNG